MKKLFLLLFSVLAFTSQVRADVEWTIWEGSMNASSSGTAGSWDNSLYLKSNNFANLSVGDVIYFTLTKNGNASGQAHVVLYYQNTLVKDAETTWPETEFTSFDTDGNCSYTITSDNLKYFNGYYDGECTSVEFINLAIKGCDFTLSKVSIKKHFSVIKTTLSDDDVSLGDWANQYEIESSKLSNVKAGDYFYVPATKQMTKDDESAVDYWQAQFYYDWTNLYNVNSVNHDIWAKIQEADVSNITSKKFHLKGQYYNCTGVYLLHPINSFNIGSIGMATFSAAQTVKVPDGLTAYKATVSGDNVTLTTFTGNIIPANQGAIIKGPQGSVVEFAATSEGSSDISDLIAVTTATDVTTLDNNYDYYVLYAGTGEKEDELDLSILLGNFGNWNNKITWDSSTNTATYTEQTPNGEGGWVGKDWSAYDKLKLNFSANTLNADATFYVAYNGHDDATTEATLTQGSTSSIEIDLNSNYKDAIGNFSMWSGATSGSITFESAALIDNDGATVAEFRKTESGTIAANKAYLRIEKSETPSKLNIVFAEDENKQDEEQQGETNSIRNIANTNVNNNVVYNMNGQRVGSDYKGLVIVNGKKLLRK